jgi:hypothetical protein
MFVSPQSRESEQKVDCVFKHIRQVEQNRELHMVANDCNPIAILLPDVSLQSMNENKYAFKSSLHIDPFLHSINAFCSSFSG